MARWDDTDWYRSSRWSPEIAEEFERRLKRARGWTRPQYLRIQGLHLTWQSDPALQAQGRSLMHRLIEEYKDADSESAFSSSLAAREVMATFECLGNAYRDVGMTEQAAANYRASINRQHALPNGRSNSSGVTELLLAEVLLDRGRLDDLAEVEALLDAVEPEIDQNALRSVVLQYFVARARLSSRLDRPDAADFARAALELASDRTPVFSRHPDVGVPDASDELLDELDRIAGE